MYPLQAPSIVGLEFKARRVGLFANGEEYPLRVNDQVIVEAAGHRATDIHIEPFETDLRIRYRVDGVLHRAKLASGVKTHQERTWGGWRR